jgi:hypothetical protein
MVVAKLSGRLGNQMFQYAAGRSMAERVGFDLDVEVGHVRRFARLPAEKWLVRGLQRLRPSSRPFLEVIRERPFSAFIPEVLEAGDNVYLDGFWQSEAYFSAHAERIRGDLSYRGRLSDEGAAAAEQLPASTSVSVHVRRGDYVTSRFMYALDADYYREAVRRIRQRVGKLRAFVFSDEPDWCEANLRFESPMLVVAHDLAHDRSLEDIHLMSKCNHHVIANSSFSWWGAWLNPSPEKIVVAPKRWFRDRNRESSEPRVPSEWIRI